MPRPHTFLAEELGVTLYLLTAADETADIR
jgi:hypothetical protein